MEGEDEQQRLQRQFEFMEKFTAKAKTPFTFGIKYPTNELYVCFEREPKAWETNGIAYYVKTKDGNYQGHPAKFSAEEEPQPSCSAASSTSRGEQHKGPEKKKSTRKRYRNRNRNVQKRVGKGCSEPGPGSAASKRAGKRWGTKDPDNNLNVGADTELKPRPENRVPKSHIKTCASLARASDEKDNEDVSVCRLRNGSYLWMD